MENSFYIRKEFSSLLTEKIWGSTLCRRPKYKHAEVRPTKMLRAPAAPRLAAALSISNLRHQDLPMTRKSQNLCLIFCSASLAKFGLLLAPYELLHQTPLLEPQVWCLEKEPFPAAELLLHSSYSWCHESLLSFTLPINHANSSCICF